VSERELYFEVALALAECQLVEQELKLYITEAFELVSKRLGQRMTFRFSGEDYADSSLEKLISAFKKLNDNALLAGDLDRFRKERNFLSHRGITSCLDHDGELTPQDVRETRVRMTQLQADGVRLRELIHEEANKFRGFLWFEDTETPE
jgi:hypothetical protein